MCFGCGTGCGQCTGSLVYVMEKLASFVALTAVVLCIMATVAVTLAVGVGLGYNYCFVDLKVMTESPKTKPSALRSQRTEEDVDDFATTTQSYRRSEATATHTPRRRTLPLPAIKHTMAIPLNGEFDFPSLLSKLRGRNRNVTLELIT